MTDVAKLSLVFGADVRGLDAGFAHARKELAGFQSYASKVKDVQLTGDTKGLASATASGQKQLTGFKALADKSRTVDITGDTKGLASATAAGGKQLSGFQRLADKARNVIFSADTRGFTGAMAGAQKSLGSFAGIADRASQVTLTADTAAFSDAIGQAEGEMAGLKQSTEDAGEASGFFRTRLATVAGTTIGLRGGIAALSGAAGLGALTVGFGAAAKQGLTLNQNMEQARIAFTSMLGSAKEANVFLQGLAQFAAKTPFEFPELVTASQRMLAFGFTAKDVRPLLTAVGNAAAAMGRGSEGVDQITYALGQMKAATVVQAGELNQLTEAGVPAFDLLAKATGNSTKEVKELVANGKIASDVFINAFQKWAQSNFGDMMAKQSKTAAGGFSTLQDNINTALRNAFNPLYKRVTDLVLKLAAFTSTDRFSKWAAAAASASGRVLDAVSGLGKELEDALDLDAPKPKGWEQAGKTAGVAFVSKVNAQMRQDAANQAGEGSPAYELGFKSGQAIGRALGKALSGGFAGGAGGKGAAGGADNPIGNWIRSHVPGAAWIDDNVADPIVSETLKGIVDGFRKSKTGKNVFGFLEKQWKDTDKLKYEGSALQKLFQKLRDDSDKTKRGATQDAWDMKRQSVAAWTAEHADAIPIFGNLAGLIAGKTAEAKEKGTKNAWTLKQQSQRAYVAQHLDAIPIWGDILQLVVSKTGEAKEKGTKNAWDTKRGSVSAWQAIMDATPVWGDIAEYVVRKSWDAKRGSNNAWGQLESFVDSVLDRLGIGTNSGSDGKIPGPKGNTGHTAGEGGRGGPQGLPMARGGIVNQAAVGGFADGSAPHAVYGEVGKREYYIVPERKDNIRYLQGAAQEMGFGLVKMARGGILDAWKKMGVPMHALGATTYNFSPYNAHMVHDIEGKYPTKANTYIGHPGGEQNSVDFWNPGGRGSPLNTGVGWNIKQYIDKNYVPYNWLIWQGKYFTSPSTWRPYWDLADMHDDHLHTTHGSSAGFSGGPVSRPNPKQQLFDLLWKPIQGLADRVFGAMKAQSFWAARAGGGLGANAVTSIHDWIDAKIPDMIGAPSGTGTAGLGGSDAVGGSPSANRAMGEKMLAASGVSGSWASLNSLWTRESGWNRFAKNPSSGAYGIPQALPESKLPPSGQSSGGSHAGAQIDWGLGYIKSRYGSTDAAWQHSQATGWYEKGGVVPGKQGKPVPIMAHAGEAVIPAHVVKAYARGGISGAPTSGWNLIHGDGALGIGGPAASAAMQGAAMWGATGVRFTSGGDVMASWSPGKAAGTTSTTGRMRIDPQFMGMPIAPALWAHEIGHALGLAHNTFGIMRPKVGAAMRPTQAEINTVRKLYGGTAQMDSTGGHGATGGSMGGSGGLRQGGWGYAGGGHARGGTGAYAGNGTARGGSTSGASGNAEMLRNSQRGANASEDAARTLRRVERILASLPRGIRESVNKNMEHGLETGRSMDVSEIRRMARRLSGGAPIARAAR